MKTTVTTFSNDLEDLLLVITTKFDSLDKISISIKVIKINLNNPHILYEGNNLSNAIDIFNKNI
jgi:hypothetical protein